jgi:hypothetical protein
LLDRNILFLLSIIRVMVSGAISSVKYFYTTVTAFEYIARIYMSMTKVSSNTVL